MNTPRVRSRLLHKLFIEKLLPCWRAFVTRVSWHRAYVRIVSVVCLSYPYGRVTDAQPGGTRHRRAPAGKQLSKKDSYAYMKDGQLISGSSEVKEKKQKPSPKTKLTMFFKITYLIICCLAFNEAHAFVVKNKFHTICNNHCKVSIKMYEINLNDSIIENGIIVRNCRIQCEILRSDNALVFAIGIDQPLSPIISVPCSEVINSDFINNRENDKKTGLWFYKYPWGRIRKIEMYKNENLHKCIYFRPNGTIHKEIYYANGKRKKFGNHTFDRNGKLLGHPNIGGG